LNTLFRSQSVASEVVREFSLEGPPHSLTPGRFLSDALAIEDVPNTYLTRVKVRLQEPQLAAKTASRVAEHLIELTARVWQDVMRDRIGELERRVEEARQGLGKAEQDWVAARVTSRNERLDVPRRVPSREGTSGAAPALADRLAESRTRTAALAEAERRLARSGPAAGQDPLGQLYAREFEIVRLENEVEVRRDVYMSAASRLEEARIEFASNPKPLRLLQAAGVPEAPLPGTRNRTIALGFLAGLVLAACLLVAREWRAQSAA
jgi:uncharacterized protein involved in exopolysaccharide biosynthesis